MTNKYCTLPECPWGLEKCDAYNPTCYCCPYFETRQCYECDKKMAHLDFDARNAETLTRAECDEIWYSPAIQLYCCTCYKHEMKMIALKKERSV